MSEGVLQGESLRPDLFLLYLADIEFFFRSRGLAELNVDGFLYYTDILTLLYDTIILAHLHVDLGRKLEALEEYCLLNSLEVNANKTKIIVFKSGGKPKQIDNRFIRFKSANIELVTSYTWAS